MKVYKVIINQQASHDLKSIYNYIAHVLNAPDIALSRVNTLASAIRGLDIFPEGNRRCQEEPWHSMNMRIMSVDKYLVYYSVDSDNFIVTVSRIVSSRSNFSQLLNDSVRPVVYSAMHDR